MDRYDTTRGTYKPALSVARDSEDHYDGFQFGDVVAVHDGRVAISWEGPYPTDFGPRSRVFEIVPAAALPALVENAAAVLRGWGEQAAAEIAAETNVPQHLVW